jgi:antitoxin component HigA of HigAB toxin-antitoxin module
MGLTLDLARYSELLLREIPKKIESDEEYDRIADRVEAIDNTANATPEEHALADLLGILLQAYDDQDGLPSSGREALAYLMEQNGLNKADLGRILGVSRGQATNIVNGQRAISKEVALKLSQHFGTNVDVFLA